MSLKLTSTFTIFHKIEKKINIDKLAKKIGDKNVKKTDDKIDKCIDRRK